MRGVVAGGDDARCRRTAGRGNVRELRNAVERAMLLAEGDELEPRATSRCWRRSARELSDGVELPAEGINLEQLERSLVVQALERSGWNQTQAADAARAEPRSDSLPHREVRSAQAVVRRRYGVCRRDRNVSVIRVPPDSGHSTAICPSCDSISRFAVAMPRPVPRAFVVLNGRNSAARISAGMPGPESAMSM